MNSSVPVIGGRYANILTEQERAFIFNLYLKEAEEQEREEAEQRSAEEKNRRIAAKDHTLS